MSRSSYLAALLALAIAAGCGPQIDDDDDTTLMPNDDDDGADDDDAVDDDDTTPDDDDTTPSDDDDSAPPCTDDGDGDGYVDAAWEGGDDCDDSNPQVHPGAVEVCANGLDDDCDGACVGCGLCGEHPLELAAAKLLGEFEGNSAGVWVAQAGDVDHDGGADIIVSAPFPAPDGVRRAYVISSPLPGAGQSGDG